MMTGSTGGDPVLIVLAILLAVAVLAALALTVTLRPAGPLRQRLSRKPGRQQGDGHGTARTEPGEDPVVIVRERYAHGEISHAEFVHILDQLLPGEADPMPGFPS